MTGPAGKTRPGGLSGEVGHAHLLALILLLFGPVTFLFNGWLPSLRPSHKNDFTSYYVAGVAVRQGLAEALYYPEPVGSLLAQASQQRPWAELARPAGIEHPNYYLYPPLFAILFAPLTLLPYSWAYVIWTGMGGLFLAGSITLITAIFPGGLKGLAGSTRGLLAAAGVVAAACLFYPVSRSLAVGQSSLLLLLLMTATMVFLRRRTGKGDLLAGCCLALAILLKLTPLVILPWLAFRRRWKALALCAAAAAVLIGVSIAVVGWTPHEVYFGRMVPLLSGGTAFYPNQSLAGVAARLAGGELRLADLVPPAAAPVLIARGLGFAMILATLLAAIRLRAGGAADPESDDRAFSLLILAGLAASPISWEHHYVLALIPGWVLVRDAAEKRWFTPRRGALAGAGLALVGSYVGLRVIGAWGDGLFAQLAATSTLAGGLLLWWILLRTPVNPPRRFAGPAPAIPVALLALLCVFAAGIFLLKLAEYNRAYRYGDFTSYYVAAATLAQGQGEPLYYPGTTDSLLARAVTPSPWTRTAERFGVKEANYYLYPPFFAMALLPLAWIPYGAAHTLWYLVNLAALCGCAWLLAAARDGEESRRGAAWIALTVVTVCLSWPSLFTFGAGQANFLVLLLLLVCLRALGSGREATAGLSAAAAAAVKMTPALVLLYLAWRRRWRALAWAAAGLAALVGGGAIVAGVDQYVVYVTRMVPELSRGCAHWINEAPAALFTRLLDGADIFSWDLASPSTISRILAAAVSGIFVAVSLALAGRPARTAGAGRRELEFCLMVVTTLFVSPLSWTHHSVLSLMGLLGAAGWMAARSSLTPGACALLALAFTLTHVHVSPPGLLESSPLNVLASYNLAGNVLTWGILAALLAASRRLERAG